MLIPCKIFIIIIIIITFQQQQKKPPPSKVKSFLVSIYDLKQKNANWCSKETVKLENLEFLYICVKQLKKRFPVMKNLTLLKFEGNCVELRVKYCILFLQTIFVKIYLKKKKQNMTRLRKLYYQVLHNFSQQKLNIYL